MMLNLNSIIQSGNLPEGGLSEAQPSFEIDTFSLQCAGRKEVEAFIKQGFKKAYGAEIKVTMPFVLAVNNGKLKAALGIRSAKSPLFIEQYLSAPIEQHNAFINKKVNRDEIAEIGHLYSNARKFTIPLFLVTAISLFYHDFKYIVFSGTGRVLSIIAAAGIEITYLEKADPSKLASSVDDWGSYYATNPQVVVISLSSVMAVIDSQPVYEQLFQQLNKKIVKVCTQLRGLK